MKTNWKLIEKSAKLIKQKSKNIISASAYLKDRPETGYFIDNISKKKVKIINCQSSTLRRYIKLLDKYYYLITSPRDQEYIISKKLEIENELSVRDDCEVEKK